MFLETGLQGRFGQAFPGAEGTATTASPQGPATAVQAGFGTNVGGEAGVDGKVYGVLSVGSLALIALVFIWWSLPD